MRPALSRRRIPLVLGCAAAAIVACAHVALAHTELRSSLPEPGQTVGGTVDRVELEFFGPVGGAEVSIADHDGHEVAIADEPEIDEATVIQRFEPLRHPGEHIVTWRVVSADGDPVEGAFAFSYDRNAPPLPDPEGGDQTAGLVFAIVTVTLLGIVVLVLFRRPARPVEA